MIYTVSILDNEGEITRSFNRHSHLLQMDFYRIIAREIMIGIHGRKASSFVMRLQSV